MLTRGAKTTDNTLTWMEATGQAALNGDLVNTPIWLTIKNTAILLGQVIQNAAGTRIMICTTAGTAGNAAEPTFATFTNAGATTADNTVTWTTIANVPSGFTNWGAPHARLQNAYALTWGLAGNSFWVASEHAETQATALTITAPTTTASTITSTYCVTKTNVPPTSANLTTGASINTTSGVNLSISGINAYLYGFTFNCGATTTGNITLGFSTNQTVTFENCTLALTNTGVSTFIDLSANIQTQLKNCTISFANAGQSLKGAAGTVIQNLILAGTVPTTLIGKTTGNICNITVFDSDLSSVTGTLVGVYSGAITLRNCKLAGGVTVASGGITHNGYVDLIRCDSAGTNYRNERYRVSGVQTTETSIVRTGGATDGTTPISWKIATSAGARWVFPFECQPIAIWNDVTTAITTLTIYGTTTGGGVPNNDDIWVEVEYPGSASFPTGSVVTTTKADALAASVTTNNSSDGSTWGGAGAGNGFKIVVPSFTPAMKGPLNIMVHVAKTSATYYIDPSPGI